ncbi:MAG: helix-turn-helix domain-containing protein [Kofleriaceae bacterium]|nr:helix-turn-helix domain-containing protein [Kofleriaceae bacterium]
MSTHFGATLRMLRVDAGMGLGELANRIGVSPAYLSRVEHGHDPVPTPDRVVAIARALQLPPLVLLEIAQGAGAAIASYLERVPEASALFLDLAGRDLGAAEIARIRAYIDRTIPARSGPAKPRLGELLTETRVVVRATCADLEDVVMVAAARLARDREQARSLARDLLEREEAAPSMMGGGVVAPHAILPGEAVRAALVVLGRPIKTRTPDAVPLQVAVVLIEPAADRRHLDRLAHVARLAGRGLAETLSPARTAEQALRLLASLDVT